MKRKNLGNIGKSIFFILLSVLLFNACEKWELDRKPEVSTGNTTEINYQEAQFNGTIELFTDDEIELRGFCYATTPFPDLQDSVLLSGSGSGAFSQAARNLTIGTTYYVRAFARSRYGTEFGNQIKFSTNSGGSLPIIQTYEADSVSSTSAFLSGSVIYEGNSPVTLRGICYAIDTTPYITNDTVHAGKGTGIFGKKVRNLFVNTIYNVRAFAVNDSGVTYGNEIIFLTEQGIGMIPEVQTKDISSISQSTALSGGIVIDGGGYMVTERGVCWSVNPNPTIKDEISFDGSGVGSFTSVLYGLSMGTTYYVRAYASNSLGTGYGDEKVFTTLTSSTLPTVVTKDVINIGETTAESGGQILSTGGSPIIARGVCYSNSPMPDINDAKTDDGTGSGSYQSFLTGLNPDQQYYVRAYARNANGTSYGDEKTFKTNGGSGLSIGQPYQGGIIFHIDASGFHGLIAAPFDQASGIPWGCYQSYLPNCNYVDIGKGASNTASIVSNCNQVDPFAAKICSDLQLNGYDDWYLPSREELNLLYNRKSDVPGLMASFYWSSSQVSAGNAWQQNFTTGLQISYGKYDPISIRAIRSF